MGALKMNGIEVTLADILPNPFRNLPAYPIDPEKIAKIKQSIKQTSFWDNLVGRKSKEHDGKIELAYGHHRLQALKELYAPSRKITIILKDLDDKTMLQMMAAENDAVYMPSPGVINETTKSARDFLRKNPGVTGNPKSKKDRIIREAQTIAKFLGWPAERVKRSLAAINAFEAGEIDRAAYEIMPTQKSAEILRVEVNAAGGVSPEVQKTVATLVRSEEIGTKDIKNEILSRKFPTKKQDKGTVELESYLSEVTKDLQRVLDKLEKILGVKKDLDSRVYRDSFEKFSLMLYLGKITSIYERFGGCVGHEPNQHTEREAIAHDCTK